MPFVKWPTAKSARVILYQLVASSLLDARHGAPMDRQSEYGQQPQRPTPIGNVAEPQPSTARLDSAFRAALQHIELMAENLRVYLMTRH